MTGPEQGPVWPGPGPQPPTWPGGPPPGAPGGPPTKPERGPRPSDVNLTVQLWIFVIIAAAVSRVAQAISSKGSPEVRAQFERDVQGDGFLARTMKQTYPNFESFDTAVFITALAMTALAALIAGLLVFLLWKGVSFSRIALQFVAAFVLVQGVLGFFSGEALIAVPAILAGIAVVGAIITASSRDTLEYLKPGSTAGSKGTTR